MWTVENVAAVASLVLVGLWPAIGITMAVRATRPISETERRSWMAGAVVLSLVTIGVGLINWHYNQKRNGELGEYIRLNSTSRVDAPTASPIPSPPEIAVARVKARERAREMGNVLFRWSAGIEHSARPPRPKSGEETTDHSWLEFSDRYQNSYASNFAADVTSVRRELAAVGISDKELNELCIGPMVPDKARLVAARLIAVADQLD
jgi:hypothetical protein